MHECAPADPQRPGSDRRILKARAAARGESLNSYLRALLEREASIPTLEETLASIARRPEKLSFSSVEELRAVRAEAEQRLDERYPLPERESDAG